ncbi:hypothetical protein T03_16075, partial [Trichinella britovi]
LAQTSRLQSLEEFQGPPLPKIVSRVDSDDLLSERGGWFPRDRLLDALLVHTQSIQRWSQSLQDH